MYIQIHDYIYVIDVSILLSNGLPFLVIPGSSAATHSFSKCPPMPLHEKYSHHHDIQWNLGGGGTHPGFGYPLQNGPQELWLSTQSRLEKELSLTQVLSEGGCRRGHTL